MEFVCGTFEDPPPINLPWVSSGCLAGYCSMGGWGFTDNRSHFVLHEIDGIEVLTRVCLCVWLVVATWVE